MVCCIGITPPIYCTGPTDIMKDIVNVFLYRTLSVSRDDKSKHYKTGIEITVV